MNQTAPQTAGKAEKTSFLRSNGLIVILALISVILSSLPIAHYILLPFEFFTTFIHEGSHAIASLIMGESVDKIVINPDTSGYMQHTVSSGIFAQGFISSAGYIGAAIVGGSLIILSSYKNTSKFLLLALGILFLAAIVLYVRDLFTLVISAGFCVALFFLAIKGSDNLCYFGLNFLAVQCALNSLSDVMTLVKLSLGARASAWSTGHSDAEAVAQMFLLPAIVWSVLWVLISLIILLYALKTSSRIRAHTSPQKES